MKLRKENLSYMVTFLPSIIPVPSVTNFVSLEYPPETPYFTMGNLKGWDKLPFAIPGLGRVPWTRPGSVASLRSSNQVPGERSGGYTWSAIPVCYCLLLRMVLNLYTTCSRKSPWPQHHPSSHTRTVWSTR